MFTAPHSNGPQGRREDRLGVGVIGPDTIGPVLAAALAGAGHALVGIHADRDDAEERVRALIPGAPIIAEAHIVERSELVIIAASDAELPAVVERLSDRKAWVQGQLVLHTAPSHGTAVLASAFDAGVIPLAVHPAIDATGTSLDLARLREAWCAVTAPRPVLPIAQALVVEFGAEPVIIAEKDRAAYGEAIATATTFIHSIVGQATTALHDIGVEDPGFFLSSLVRSATDRALANGRPQRFHPDEVTGSTSVEPDRDAHPGAASRGGLDEHPEAGRDAGRGPASGA